MDPSKIICEDNKIIYKNKKKYYNEVNFDRTNSNIKYFLEKDLSNLNPSVRSIINFSALNLKKYNYKIKIFFSKNDTIQIDEVMYFFFRKTYLVDDWNKNAMEKMYEAFGMVCDFLGIELDVVEDYEDADIVLTCFSEKLDFYGVSTFPFELDLYKILNKKLFIFNSYLPADDNYSRGSFRFYIFLHHILHCFGLYHPEKFIFDSTLTVMSEGDKYPASLMPLDIEALKFLYKVNDLKNYVDWIAFDSPTGVLQSLIGDIKLDIPPHYKKYNLILNSVSLDKHQYNYVSSFVDDRKGGSILCAGSKIKEVNVSCEILNIYVYYLEFNTIVNVISKNVKCVNIYIKDSERNLKIEEGVGKVRLGGNGVTLEILFKEYLGVEIELYLMEESDFVFEESVKKKGVKFVEKIKENKNEISYFLSPESYEKMIDSFFKENPDFVYKNDEKLIQLLKLYAVGYYVKKFKERIRDETFPLLGEILSKKKSEFKNTKI